MESTVIQKPAFASRDVKFSACVCQSRIGRIVVPYQLVRRTPGVASPHLHTHTHSHTHTQTQPTGLARMVLRATPTVHLALAPCYAHAHKSTTAIIRNRDTRASPVLPSTTTNLTSQRPHWLLCQCCSQDPPSPLAPQKAAACLGLQTSCRCSQTWRALASPPHWRVRHRRRPSARSRSRRPCRPHGLAKQVRTHQHVSGI